MKQMPSKTSALMLVLTALSARAPAQSAPARCAERVQQINAEDSQINAVLAEIKTVSNGQQDLTPYALPTNVTADAAGAATLQSVADNKVLVGLMDRLKAAADSAQTTGDGAQPAAGAQPPVSLSDGQRIALLALSAGKRIAPAVVQGQPDGVAAAYDAAMKCFAAGVRGSSDGGPASRGMQKIKGVVSGAAAAAGDMDGARASNGAAVAAVLPDAPTPKFGFHSVAVNGG